MITLPLAENSTGTPASAAWAAEPLVAPSGTVAASRTWALVPVASAIWEATVRFQMRS